MFRLSLLRAVLCAAIAGLGAAALPAQATSFSDGTFADTDWTSQILPYANSDPGASFSSGQVATGGFPGAYRQTTQNYIGPNQGIVVGHVATNEVYNPAGGALASLDFDFDFNFFNYPGTGPNPSFAVGVGALVEQGGQYYLAGGPAAVSNTWVHYALSKTAADFSLLTNPSAHPDFSAAGGVIRLGYFTANGTCCEVPTSTTSGLDNWNAQLNSTSAPEPAAWALMLLGFAATGAALRRRDGLRLRRA